MNLECLRCAFQEKRVPLPVCSFNVVAGILVEDAFLGTTPKSVIPCEGAGTMLHCFFFALGQFPNNFVLLQSFVSADGVCHKAKRSEMDQQTISLTNKTPDTCSLNIAEQNNGNSNSNMVLHTMRERDIK